MTNVIIRKVFNPSELSHKCVTTPGLLNKIKQERIPFKLFKKYLSILETKRNIESIVKINPKSVFQYVFLKTKSKEAVANLIGKVVNSQKMLFKRQKF